MLNTNERETHLNMSGDNHNEWELFTDDPYWVRRLANLGITPYRVVGEGKWYRLNADMVLLRKGKRRVSDAQRNAGRLNLKTASPTKGFQAQNASGGE